MPGIAIISPAPCGTSALLLVWLAIGPSSIGWRDATSARPRRNGGNHGLWVGDVEVARQLGPGPHPQLAVDARQVHLDGAHGEEQRRCDLLVLATLGGKF